MSDDNSDDSDDNLFASLFFAVYSLFLYGNYFIINDKVVYNESC